MQRKGFNLGEVKFILMAKRNFAIHLITLNNILYMQFSIIRTAAADFVKINICIFLNIFCQCRISSNIYVNTYSFLLWIKLITEIYAPENFESTYKCFVFVKCQHV